MALDVVNPLSLAFRRMIKVCFKPFDIRKWFLLGFCFWLSTCGEGGGGNFNMPSGNSSSSRYGSSGNTDFSEFREALHHGSQWVTANMAMVVILGIVAFFVGLALLILVTWLKARGTFMFIDGVVHNRGLVTQPWNDYAKEGNSYWLLLLVLDIVTFILLGGFAVVGLIMMGGVIFQGLPFTGGLVLGLVLLGLACLLIWIPVGFSLFVIHTFVPQVMYIRRIGARESIGVVWREIFKPHWGSLILFGLMNLVLGIGIALATTLFGCITCCIGFVLLMIPYIGTVLILPVGVFMKSYALYFMEQVGSNFVIIPRDPMEGGQGFPVYPLVPVQPGQSPNDGNSGQ